MKAGRVIGRHKMAKHIRLTIRGGIFTWSRRRTRSSERVRWMRSMWSAPADRRSGCRPRRACAVQAAIAGGAVVPLPGGDRPAGAADVHGSSPSAPPCLVCVLAYYVEWRLRRAWRSLLFEDEEFDRIARSEIRWRRQPSASVRRKKKTHQTAGICRCTVLDLAGALGWSQA